MAKDCVDVSVNGVRVGGKGVERVLLFQRTGMIDELEFTDVVGLLRSAMELLRRASLSCLMIGLMDRTYGTMGITPQYLVQQCGRMGNCYAQRTLDGMLSDTSKAGIEDII